MDVKIQVLQHVSIAILDIEKALYSPANGKIEILSSNEDKSASGVLFAERDAARTNKPVGPGESTAAAAGSIFPDDVGVVGGSGGRGT